jgi:CBS domain-containing protein
LPPETSIATAIEAMRRRGRGNAVVVRTQRPVGLLCDRDILAQACGDIDDLRAVPISALMVPCPDPLREDDTVGTALRKMCAHRQWHLPIVCGRGLFVGALDIAELWLRDRLTVMSVEAAFT